MTVFTSLLNNDFTQERRVRVPDGQGGWNIVFVPIAIIRGRLRPASSTEIVAAQQEQRRISHVFYCLESDDIVRGDRITGDDLTVDVMAIREPSRADEHYEIDCLEEQLEQAQELGS
jgi:SPP1 family predicted phage head-tail adaptor